MIDALKKILQIAEKTKRISNPRKKKWWALIALDTAVEQNNKRLMQEREIIINNTDMEIRAGVQQGLVVGPLLLSSSTMNC